MIRTGEIRPLNLPSQRFSLFERGLAGLGMYERAVVRYQKRMAYEQARSVMEAAGTDRLKGNWQRLGVDPKKLTQGSRKASSERADWLVLNDPVARHCVDVLADNTVGTGIRTQSKIRYSKEDITNEKTNQKVEDLKSRWMEQADATGRMHWHEMQNLWLSRVATVGDILRHRVFLDDPKRVLPLAYELIETARMTDMGITKADRGNEVAQGVEYDPKTSRVVAYHVERGDYRRTVDRLLAEDCDLGFRMDRPGQIRGVTWMAPVISHIFTLRDLIEYTMIARKVQASVAVIVSDSPRGKAKGLPGLNRGTGETAVTSGSGDSKYPLEPGMMHHIGEGDVSVLQPSQNHDFEGLTKSLLRGIGVGWGFSYEWVSGNYEGTTFSGGRMSNQEARRRIRPVHMFEVAHLERPVHLDFIDCALAFRKMPKPPPGRDVYESRFSKPHWEWGVNPLQEVKAAMEAVKGGLSTYRDEVEARGGDWQEVMRQIAREMSFGEGQELDLYPDLRKDEAGGEDDPAKSPEKGKNK